MDSAWYLPLARLTTADLAIAGGKGANLGELVRAGFNVPEGFVVTTAAYRHGVGGLAVLDRASVESVEIPADVRDAVLAAYAELGGGPVAVRSSATAEDLAGAAFAGQQDTFLGVVGPDVLLKATRSCWASLWNDRAVAYRARLGIDPASVAIAVVVQRMVAAEHAGVLLTADPVTGDRDLVVVDSSPGLGEAVVAGLVTPDHAVVDASGRVISRRAGRHEVEIRLRADGGTDTVAGTPDDSGAASLSDTDLLRLAVVGRRIADHFGRPQDIEWALADGELSVLQARPMTALPPPPVPLSRRQRLVGPVILELLPRRPYPLELDAWLLPSIGRHVEELIDGLVGGHVRAAEWLPTSDGVVQSYVPPEPRPTHRTPRRLLRTISRMRRDPQAWAADPRYASYLAGIARLTAIDVATASWSELLAMPDEVARLIPILTDLRVAYLPPAGGALVRLRLLLKLLGLKKLFKDLLIDAPTVTQAANSELAELADLALQNPMVAAWFTDPDVDDATLLHRIESEPEAAAFQTRLGSYLDRFGHRETASILLPRDPCWVDSPQTVLALVRVLAGSAAASPASRSRAALERLLAHPLIGRAKAQASVERLVATAAAGIASREDTHFELTRPMPVVHRTLWEIGRRLATAGVLAETEDVWFLTWAEVSRLADPAGAPPDPGLQEIVRRRRVAQAELASCPLIAAANLYPRSAVDDMALARGVGGGGGRASGVVRIISDPDGFGSLRAGEVLVCPATNPSWTPLFARAAAVVVDHGGLASHAAIVAREYGIPAVLGCGTATATLTNGQPVLVDGDRGLVLPGDSDD